MTSQLKLGAHMSTAGGSYRALERGTEIGCTAVQLFTKNANQWAAKPIGPEEVSYSTSTGEGSVRRRRPHRPQLISHKPRNAGRHALGEVAGSVSGTSLTAATRWECLRW